MKAVKVQYSVKPEFIETNKANIKKVMDRLKDEPIRDLLYATFTLDNDQTFVHINYARNQEALDQLQLLPEFINFRAALKNSDPEIPPSSENLNLVAAGFEF